MFSTYINTGAVLGAMLVTGIILAPAVMATPAVQDLTDLRDVINAAANTIGDLNNPNRGWGLFGSSSQMGTADTVNNVTATILQSKFQVDTNKTMWLNPANTTLNTTELPSWTPTLPLSSSLVLPSTLPTSTLSLENITVDLSTPYTDYVSSIPNLSTSLTSLGRAWHREINSPVSEAIDMLQESITALQTTMLQNGLIDSSAILRTIRASSSLESAQQAWSRFLNLPGYAGSSDTPQKRSVMRLPPANGRYTHKELWGRGEQSKLGEPSRDDARMEQMEEAEDLKHGTAHLFRA